MDMDAALVTLEGTSVPPPGTTPTTMVILEEIARIWAKMGAGKVEITVSFEDFQYYWNRAKEKNSVVILWAAFWILQSHHTLWHPVQNTCSQTLTNYKNRVSARQMGQRAVHNVEKKNRVGRPSYKTMSHPADGSILQLLQLHDNTSWFQKEIFNEKGETTEDAILQQVLLYDITRQLKQPLVVVLVDAAQWYDRVAHAMTALTLRAYNVRQSLVMRMLQPIQNMEYYLRTEYGESTTYSGGKGDKKTGPLPRQRVNAIGVPDAYLSSGQCSKKHGQWHPHKKPDLPEINQASENSLCW